jgi:hypothetical protein
MYQIVEGISFGILRMEAAGLTETLAPTNQTTLFRSRRLQFYNLLWVEAHGNMDFY